MNNIFKSDNELIFEQYNKNIAHNKLILSKISSYIPGINSINDINDIDEVETKLPYHYICFDSGRTASNLTAHNKQLHTDDARYSVLIADDLEHKQIIIDYIFDNVDDLIDYLNENVDDIIVNGLHGNLFDFVYYVVNRIKNELGEEVANKIKLPEYYKTIECEPQSNKLAKKVTKLCKGKTKTEIIDLLYQMFPYVVVVSDGFEIYPVTSHDKSTSIEFLKHMDSLHFYSINDSDDCGVMEGEPYNCCWFIPNIDVFKNYFKEFIYNQIGWKYGDKNTPDPISYEDYKSDAFNICSTFGLSHSESVTVLHGNVHKQFGISDDEYVDLFGDD